MDAESLKEVSLKATECKRATATKKFYTDWPLVWNDLHLELFTAAREGRFSEYFILSRYIGMIERSKVTSMEFRLMELDKKLLVENLKEKGFTVHYDHPTLHISWR